MRISRITRRALPAFTFLLLGIPMLATAAGTKVYACLSFGPTVLPLSADPLNGGCPPGSSMAILGSVSAGGSAPVTLLASGAPGGKATLSSLTLTKYRDATSESLLRAAETEGLLGSVSIAIYDASSGVSPQKPTYNILLKSVRVTGWSWSASGGSATAATADIGETVSLSFRDITIVDNTTGQTVSWNVALNTPTP